MKYLYANGCSFVWGDEIDGPEENRWSRIFSERYNVEEINESENGSSNNRIYRTTKDWVLSNKDKLEDTFVVLGWSQSIRIERYNDVAKMYESINFATEPDYMSSSYNNGMDATGQIEDGSDYGPFWGKSPSRRFWKNYVKYYFDDHYFNEESALRVFAMQELLEKLNVKYYFYFSMENNVVHYIQRKYKDLYNFDKIYHQSQEDWISDIVKKETGDIIEWDDKVNTYFNPRGGWTGFSGSHPDKKSHSLWAEFLYEKYKRLYT